LRVPPVEFSDVFFLPGQGAFDASWMDCDAEPFLNGGSQTYSVERRIGCAKLDCEVQNIGREFVPLPRTSFLGQKTI
jgi:hypothetical protein